MSELIYTKRLHYDLLPSVSLYLIYVHGVFTKLDRM